MAVFASLSYFVLIVSIPFVNSLSFNFDSFNPNDQNISYEADAYSENSVIQLTKNGSEFSIGRATYSKRLYLYDNASGNVTDFSTHFSFGINSQGRNLYADGLTFFLAPEGSVIPDKHFAAGEGLGLASDNQQYSWKYHHFVAVEFDIFSNSYDPRGDHVGVDINSMQFVATVTWLSSIPNGTRADAWITYNSISRNLSVVFTGFQKQGNTTVTVLQNLSYNLDLKAYLPEWVTFGFSGATGTFSAIHTIYSWNFTSSLNYNGNITDTDIPLPSPVPNPDVPLPSHAPNSCIQSFNCSVQLLLFVLFIISTVLKMIE